MAAAALWLVPIVFVAFVVRTSLVLALRNRSPETAAAVDRWWVWTPLVFVIGLFVIAVVAVSITNPLLGILVAGFGGTLLYFLLFRASSIGSPFRPRRR